MDLKESLKVRKCLFGVLSRDRVCLFLPTILVLTGIVYLSTTGPYPLRRLPVSISPEQQKRIDRISNVCAYREHADLGKNSTTTTLDIIYAAKYNLAYMNIPKIGSTFLKQLFLILKYGVEDAHQVFRKMRMAVHGTTGLLISHKTDLNKVLTVISVRNPFTRLFSAYIDKVFLPISFALGKEILYERYMVRMLTQTCKQMNIQGVSEIRKSLACTHTISFEDFLYYVTAEPLKGKPLFDHFAPCSHLMSRSICSLGQTILIKQETFADDVKYLLKFINTEEEIYNIIDTYLHVKRAETNVRSIVSTAYKLVKKQYSIASCWTMFELAERLWKSFQFQGYIKYSSDFPTHLFSNNTPEQDYLITVILDEIKRNPLTESESKIQRVRAVTEAYENVGDHLIRDLQKMYALDFEMFDYDSSPWNL